MRWPVGLLVVGVVGIMIGSQTFPRLIIQTSTVTVTVVSECKVAPFSSESPGSQGSGSHTAGKVVSE